MIGLDEFLIKAGFRSMWHAHNDEAHLPCFAHRYNVTPAINTPRLIQAYLHYACEHDENDIDVFVFSVTERDGPAWHAWKDYAKANPRKFKVVEGGSIHGRYQCRMYIYTKPKAEHRLNQPNPRFR